jgi:hypothetical protein
MKRHGDDGQGISGNFISSLTQNVANFTCPWEDGYRHHLFTKNGVIMLTLMMSLHHVALIWMAWSLHDSGEVMFTYPESNHSQFRKTGAMVVLNQSQWMHPTMVLHETLVYSISGYSQITIDHDNTNEVAIDGLHPLL